MAQLIEQFDQHSYSSNNTSVNSTGFVQISSPTPTPTSNLIINEIDFNLIINGNTSLSSATGSSTGSSNLIGAYSIQGSTSANSASFMPSNTIQSQVSQQNLLSKTSNDMIDGRGGDRGTGTPVFFNSSNLMIGGASSNGLYSQLTNATSSTALNSMSQSVTISNLNLNPTSNSSTSATNASSPINLQSGLPSVVNSVISSDVMKRSDSKGKHLI